MYHRWTCKKRQLLEPCSFSKRINLQCYFFAAYFWTNSWKEDLVSKIFFVLLVGAKWFLASRLWRLINQMNGGGGDLSQLKLSLRFRSRLSRNSIKRPAPHILGIRCSLNRNPNPVEVLSCSTATHCYHWKVLETLEFTNCLCLNVRYLVSRRVKCQIIYQNKYNNRISLISSLISLPQKNICTLEKRIS